MYIKHNNIITNAIIIKILLNGGLRQGPICSKRHLKSFVYSELLVGVAVSRVELHAKSGRRLSGFTF